MRLAVLIILSAAVAVALVSIRRAEMAARHQTVQLLKQRDVDLPRRLYNQEVELRTQMAPGEVGRRAAEMALKVAPKEKTQFCVVAGPTPPAQCPAGGR